MSLFQDTIVAIATPQGIGALGMVRLSGSNALNIANALFTGKNMMQQASHSLHVGRLTHKEVFIDEVVLGIYRNPKSFTGEDIVEISCHGSNYIIQLIIDAFIQEGARLALPGEFTQRAYINGKLDLTQAEAVADVIASENAAQHSIALKQLRGGFSYALQHLREQLINFTALIELELDFSQEDVEFVDRTALQQLIHTIKEKVQELTSSFQYGNAIKKGIPVAIVGKPNVGKSTLLNALLNEEKAIVSDIAGTTRDAIEDVININGIAYRFIDTAGLRETTDTIESMGIERSLQKVKEATIIFLLVDAAEPVQDIVAQYNALQTTAEQKVIILINKIDAFEACNGYDVEEAVATLTGCVSLAIAAKTKMHLDKIPTLLGNAMQLRKYSANDIVITNARHKNALEQTLVHINAIEQGMQQGLSGDLLTIDIRLALQSLGVITGAIDIDQDILGAIFGKFCIGK
jgi:tRNA modification GTPase